MLQHLPVPKTFTQTLPEHHPAAQCQNTSECSSLKWACCWGSNKTSLGLSPKLETPSPARCGDRVWQYPVLWIGKLSTCRPYVKPFVCQHACRERRHSHVSTFKLVNIRHDPETPNPTPQTALQTLSELGFLLHLLRQPESGLPFCGPGLAAKSLKLSPLCH